MKITRQVKLLLVAVLMAVGIGGATVGVTHAASTQGSATTANASASDGETNDDTTSANDAQDKGNGAEATKSAAVDTDNVQDTGTNDNTAQ